MHTLLLGPYHQLPHSVLPSLVSTWSTLGKHGWWHGDVLCGCKVSLRWSGLGLVGGPWREPQFEVYHWKVGSGKGRRQEGLDQLCPIWLTLQLHGVTHGVLVTHLCHKHTPPTP